MHPVNASSLASFAAYHDMQKNREHFCSKFYINDVNHTTEENIKVFEDTLKNRYIQHEDVTCRLFPYFLDEEVFYWYINLSVDYVGTWQQMKDTFLAKFRLHVSPTEVYWQFIEVRRQEREPIGAFSNRF